MNGTDRPDPPAPPDAAYAWPQCRLSGIAVSGGIAIGPSFSPEEMAAPVPRRVIAQDLVETELARLDAAVAESRKQLVKLRSRIGVLPESSQSEIAPLLDAYMQMLGQSRLMRQVRRRVMERLVCPEAALQDEVEAIVQVFGQTPGLDQGRRAEEVREIGRRVLRNLTGTPFRSYADAPDGAVLVVEALRPSDVVLLNPARLGGVATEEGGADGHTAIMLRALGLPAVLGVPGLMATMRPGDLAVVDGGSGEVTLCPAPDTLVRARDAAGAHAREQQRFARLRDLPAVTLDGAEIDLFANMELPAELPLIAQAGAGGIGLLRTEFLFMRQDGLPDEDAQAALYADIVGAMAGRPVTLRVLDWGGEKEGELLPGEVDAAPQNPALGLRGIRLLLRRPELFETQLAAMLRAAGAGPVRILLPMVTSVTEVRAVREILDRVAKRLRRRGVRLPDRLPPLGIMIETPGAALSADALALEADFFAIGTNDLTMYTLAVDRADTELAKLYDPLHPAVLRLVQFSVEAAMRLRRPVSICGELAGDPRATRLLLGIGLRCFSTRAASIPAIKQVVRACRIDDCARFARKVLEETDLDRIRAMVAASGAVNG